MERRLPDEVEMHAAFRLQPGAVYLLRLTNYLPSIQLQQLREQLTEMGRWVSETQPCRFMLLPPNVEPVKTVEAPVAWAIARKAGTTMNQPTMPSIADVSEKDGLADVTQSRHILCQNCGEFLGTCESPEYLKATCQACSTDGTVRYEFVGTHCTLTTLESSDA